MLLGLILDQGLLLTCRTKAELHRYAPDAYRAYRRGLKQAGVAGDLVTAVRTLRDGVIALWRRCFSQPRYDLVMPGNKRVTVQFIGVWDTVSAYGLPIAELTRGIDRWISPLSLPDNRLPEGVETARHALSLDDEREAFHPLLWDEVTSNDPARISQVWFAGMHADVGGGYPHDGLAVIPLTWMMREAAAAGLRFKPGAIEEAERWVGHSRRNTRDFPAVPRRLLPLSAASHKCATRPARSGHARYAQHLARRPRTAPGRRRNSRKCL